MDYSKLTDGNSHTKYIHYHLNGSGAMRRINIYMVHQQRQNGSQYNTNKHNEKETRRDRYRLRDGSHKDGRSQTAGNTQNDAQSDTYFELDRQEFPEIAMVDRSNCQAPNNYKGYQQSHITPEKE
jgi:hypothetical protein